MGFLEIFLTGVGLSMDAFAVAICKGLKMKRLSVGRTAVIALFFGGFQAFMPFLGWLLGKSFERYITNFDHWIAFALLGFIGGKMIYDSFKDEEDDCCDGLDLKELTVMAIATSIDALAVGITFAFLKVDLFSTLSALLNVLAAVAIIGVTTFVLSSVGVFIGHKFGVVFKNKAELSGGIILILIGLKILLEHLGVLNF